MGAKVQQLMEVVYGKNLNLMYWMEVKSKDFNALQSSALDISDMNEL